MGRQKMAPSSPGLVACGIVIAIVGRSRVAESSDLLVGLRDAIDA